VKGVKRWADHQTNIKNQDRQTTIIKQTTNKQSNNQTEEETNKHRNDKRLPFTIYSFFNVGSIARSIITIITTAKKKHF
jgi:hypothetical protein